MNWLRDTMRGSPLAARALPFVIFLVLTGLKDVFGANGTYWIYLAKSLVGAWLIWEVWKLVPEMRWNFSWEAVAIGVGICVLWVAIDPYYTKSSQLFTEPNMSPAEAERLAKHAIPPWNPFDAFGAGSAMGWFFVVVRTLGSTLVVPPLEETFYRSFVYRYTIKEDFMSVPLNACKWWPVVLTSCIFAMTHEQWLGAILCGMAYQWLVIRKNRLGDAITAHAITNFLLSIWVVWKGDWKFW